MNFGYAYIDGQTCSIKLAAADEPDRYSWQLYEHMLRHHAPGPQNKVLEVGSGRGGACFLVSKYYNPESVVGIDLSNDAVAFCQKNYKSSNLSYITSSADALLVESETIDIVMNAESSHAYPDFDKFVNEVKRVLKPGGYFMTTDNRKSDLLHIWKDKLLASGFILESEMDITPNVLKSLDAQEQTKQDLIDKRVPFYFKKQFKEFAGMKGSTMYEDFSLRRRVYKSYILRKPE